jgi:hypothetical protein
LVRGLPAQKDGQKVGTLLSSRLDGSCRGTIRLWLARLSILLCRLIAFTEGDAINAWINGTAAFKAAKAALLAGSVAAPSATSRQVAPSVEEDAGLTGLGMFTR